MELRTESLVGDDTIRAALFGPMVLAADLGAAPEGAIRLIQDTFPKQIPPSDPLPRVAVRADAEKVEWIQPAGNSELQFRAEGESARFNLMPLCQIRDQKYSVYWQMRSRQQE
jgi:hypothetical protein